MFFILLQIKPHPFVSKLYKDSYFETLTFDSQVVPSHGPPRPWTTIYTGGYIMTKTDFTRVPDYTVSLYLICLLSVEYLCNIIQDAVNDIGVFKMYYLRSFVFFLQSLLKFNIY